MSERPLQAHQPVRPGFTLLYSGRPPCSSSSPGMKGARADDGHVAGHGVEELGQLVERRLAQDAAHGGDAALYCVRCLRENYLDCTDWVSSNISLCAILFGWKEVSCAYARFDSRH